MSYLKVTLVDVGWGDSILIEASDATARRPCFALIDSNDNAERIYWPSWNSLRKHFGMRDDEFSVQKPFSTWRRSPMTTQTMGPGSSGS